MKSQSYGHYFLGHHRVTIFEDAVMMPSEIGIPLSMPREEENRKPMPVHTL